MKQVLDKEQFSFESLRVLSQIKGLNLAKMFTFDKT